MKHQISLAILSLLALLSIPDVSKAATFSPAVTNGGSGTSKAQITLFDNLEEDPMVELTTAPDVAFPKQYADGRSRNNLNAEKVTDGISVTNPGLADGWHVQVTASDFKTTTGNTLTGAQLKFGQGTVTSDTGEEADDDTFNPGHKKIETQPVVASQTPQTIFSATEGSGIGTNAAAYTPTAVSLDIMSNTAVAGTYSADLTWTVALSPE
ncbi:WxL domain-containing protein [Lactiplantibacillus nangangensis]|uniref:WxL domain-containing protein n=1 Tax=Lactiplantibacillus nangangensis TaxID=2559917 RepID=A0ABW1SG25_9LACO|nr:WxL domain-containing protein [Lactiplantibacillus nangangensis]